MNSISISPWENQYTKPNQHTNYNRVYTYARTTDHRPSPLQAWFDDVRLPVVPSGCLVRSVARAPNGSSGAAQIGLEARLTVQSSGPRTHLTTPLNHPPAAGQDGFVPHIGLEESGFAMSNPGISPSSGRPGPFAVGSVSLCAGSQRETCLMERWMLTVNPCHQQANHATVYRCHPGANAHEINHQLGAGPDGGRRP